MKKEAEFKTYLQSKHAFDYDVEQHISNVNYFNTWFKQNSMKDIIRTTTIVIMAYITYLQKTNIQTGTINIRLNSLRKYFACMIKLGYITRNPAANIHVKGAVEKVVENPLSAATLNEMYQKFVAFIDTKPKAINITVNANQLTGQRYKLILSLMVYQGLDTGELDRLNVVDVDLNNQTIYIAGKTRRNSRVLKLESLQVLPFYQYLQSLPPQQEKLFDIKVQTIAFYLLPFVKGIEPQVRNAEHIRQSRIMIWVSTLKLRDAQYRIGHRYVSSTEKYFIQDTTELVDEINKLHLFK